MALDEVPCYTFSRFRQSVLRFRDEIPIKQVPFLLPIYLIIHIRQGIATILIQLPHAGTKMTQLRYRIFTKLAVVTVFLRL